MESWLAQLVADTRVVRAPGDERATPLVLDARSVYLDRYWAWETALVAGVMARLGRDGRADITALPQILERLFPNQDGFDRQQLAVAVAALGRFTIVVGGPGTGKTHTVVRILAAILQLTQESPQAEPRIALMAPTGKAAARLDASIGQQQASLGLSLPRATTIHRALGARLDGTVRRTAANPLDADVVVVDETSMVPLHLMARLLEAIPTDARLILLGDADQLAPVEAGSVLGDLCEAAGHHYSPILAADLATLGHPLPPELVSSSVGPGLADATVRLTKTHRFSAASGIRALSEAINAGDGTAALEVCRQFDDVSLVDGDLATVLHPLAVEGWRRTVAERDAAVALTHLTEFAVLGVHRGGRRGVADLNRSIEQWLSEAGAIEPSSEHYRGRPIIISRNDHILRLYNGDVGILTAEGGRLRARFPNHDRELTPLRLPEHETVYATTVHKAQGSDYDHVVLVLPEADSAILTRELLYTAVTRARDRVTIIGDSEILREGIQRRVRRMSGLARRLSAIS